MKIKDFVVGGGYYFIHNGKPYQDARVYTCVKITESHIHIEDYHYRLKDKHDLGVLENYQPVPSLINELL
jgi:hypothetical protein